MILMLGELHIMLTWLASCGKCYSTVYTYFRAELYWPIMYPQNLPVDLVAQLVEHFSGITKVLVLFRHVFNYTVAFITSRIIYTKKLWELLLLIRGSGLPFYQQNRFSKQAEHSQASLYIIMPTQYIIWIRNMPPFWALHVDCFAFISLQIQGSGLARQH